MLQAVIEEMQDDNAFPEAAPQAMASTRLEPMPIMPLKHPEMGADQRTGLDRRASARQEQGIDPKLFHDLIADRDARIAQLEAAVAELEQVQKSSNRHEQILSERLANLEAKLHEQEITVRQTLTTLIEWIEGDGTKRFAA